MNNEQNLNTVQKPVLHKANVIGRLLCRIGLHKWSEGYSGSTISPIADKCDRCRIVRVFHGWGYSYGRDANDL